MKEIKTVGYKIVFSTEMDRESIEEYIEELLREVEAKPSIAHVHEMTDEEVNETIKSF